MSIAHILQILAVPVVTEVQQISILASATTYNLRNFFTEFLTEIGHLFRLNLRIPRHTGIYAEQCKHKTDSNYYINSDNCRITIANQQLQMSNYQLRTFSTYSNQIQVKVDDMPSAPTRIHASTIAIISIIYRMVIINIINRITE